MFRPAVFLLCFLPAAASAQTLWQGDGARVETVSYACASGMDDLTVAYFTAREGSSFAAVHVAGVVHAMVQEVSGSGLRYVDIDGETGYRLHTKGDLLLFLKQAPEEAAEEELLAECAVVKS